MKQKVTLRPPEFDSIQYTGKNILEIQKFIGEDVGIHFEEETCVISNCGIKEGFSYLDEKGWVLKDKDGNFWTETEVDYKEKYIQ